MDTSSHLKVESNTVESNEQGGNTHLFAFLYTHLASAQALVRKGIRASPCSQHDCRKRTIQYADDLAILAPNEHKLQKALNDLQV